MGRAGRPEGPGEQDTSLLARVASRCEGARTGTSALRRQRGGQRPVARPGVAAPASVPSCPLGFSRCRSPAPRPSRVALCGRRHLPALRGGGPEAPARSLRQEPVLPREMCGPRVRVRGLVSSSFRAALPRAHPGTCCQGPAPRPRPRPLLPSGSLHPASCAPLLGAACLRPREEPESAQARRIPHRGRARPAPGLLRCRSGRLLG